MQEKSCLQKKKKLSVTAESPLSDITNKESVDCWLQSSPKHQKSIHLQEVGVIITQH